MRFAFAKKNGKREVESKIGRITQSPFYRCHELDCGY
jgi:hypothetical protein